MELQERIAIGAVCQALAPDRSKQSWEGIQDVVEVALCILIAEASEGAAVHFEFGDSAVGQLDTLISALAKPFRELEKRGPEESIDIKNSQIRPLRRKKK